MFASAILASAAVWMPAGVVLPGAPDGVPHGARPLSTLVEDLVPSIGQHDQFLEEVKKDRRHGPPQSGPGGGVGLVAGTAQHDGSQISQHARIRAHAGQHARLTRIGLVIPPRRDRGRRSCLGRQRPHALEGVDAVQREGLVGIHHVEVPVQMEVAFHHLALESVQESPHDLWIHALVLRTQVGRMPRFRDEIGELGVAEIMGEMRDQIANLPDVGRSLCRVDPQDLSQILDVRPRKLRHFGLGEKSSSEQTRHHGKSAAFLYVLCMKWVCSEEVPASSKCTAGR